MIKTGGKSATDKGAIDTRFKSKHMTDYAYIQKTRIHFSDLYLITSAIN